MIHKILDDKTTEYLMDVKNRRQREETDVRESELYDIDFTLYLDTAVFQILGIAIVFLLLLFIKTFPSELYQLIVQHQIPDFGTSYFVTSYFGCLLFGVAVVVFIAATILYLRLWLQPKPHIVRDRIQYRGKTYHYREVTCIRIHTAQLTTVYVANKRLFTVTGDYVNYGSLIAWAEACRIPVHQKAKKEMDLEEIEQFTQKVYVVLLVIVILFPVILVAYYLLN